MQLDLDPVSRTIRQGQVMPDDGVGLPILDAVEALHHANRDVRGFGQGELLCWNGLERLVLHVYMSRRRIGRRGNFALEIKRRKREKFA